MENLYMTDQKQESDAHVVEHVGLFNAEANHGATGQFFAGAPEGTQDIRNIM